MEQNTPLLRVAVVGLTRGRVHVEDYSKNPHVGRIAICDTNEAYLQTVGDAYGIPADARYTSYEEMLQAEQPDAVSVTTPNCMHRDMTVKAMEAGAHVLTEKPMAPNAADAAIMLEASKRTGKLLGVNFNRRFETCCRAAKRLYDEGRLGKVYFVTTHWHRSRGVPWWYPLKNAITIVGGGPLIDLGCHMMDRALHICGYPKIVEVMGGAWLAVSQEEARQRGIEVFSVEDFGAAMLRTEDGAMFEVESSWASNREEEYVETRIYGTKGGVQMKVTLGEEDLEEYHAFLPEGNTVVTHPLCKFAPEDNGNEHDDFIDAILNHRQPLCTGEEGLALCRIVDAIYESARSGKAVRLD